MGYFVVEDVQITNGMYMMGSIITPIPAFPHRGGRGVICFPHPSPLPEGEGTLIGIHALFLSLRGISVAIGIGEAVSDELFCCVHAVADFDAGGFAAHGFREEAGDVFTVSGEADDVLL